MQDITTPQSLRRDIESNPKLSSKRNRSSATSSRALGYQFDGGDEARSDRPRNADGGNNGAGAGNAPDGGGEGQIKKNTGRERQTKPKKIKRYESNSIDEEEFQDYFTNPIKRKEFDRQRKKQQMREMHNITGFTLGQFGIKSMKALKEAMPAYPDEDDAYGINDASKNYATVSLCCLSVTNPFRNKIIQLVAVNPWFDRLILIVIMINCVFLALDKEVQAVTEKADVIDFVFLQIYTLEMMLKVIAMGFVMRAHSYLRDSWNILDFTVVFLGWVGQFVKGNDVSAIKVIRILRPLRTINQIPNMSSLVSTILNSLPIMFDVMVLFFFMLIMFGTIATQLLGGHLQKRCILYEDDKMVYADILPNTDVAKPMIALGESQIEILCQEQKDCTDQVPKPLTTKCEYYGDPIQGTFSFDNILLSIMNIFQIITLEGWTDMMYIVRDAERSNGYDPFFVLSVVLGSFVIMNLMIAVQASYLDQAFDEEDNRQKEIKEKIELKKRMKMEQEEEEEEEYDDEDDMEQDNPDEDDRDADQLSDQENPNEERRRTSKKKKVVEKKKGCLSCCTLPPSVVALSVKVEVIYEMPIFEKIIIVLILLNTMFLALEHYDQADLLTTCQDVANYFFSFVFLLEMIGKLFGFGCRKYLDDNFNIFDGFVVTMSLVEMCMPGGEGGLSVLRAFRLLRIFKIIKSWKSLRLLLSTVLSSLTAITNLGVLICLFLFISALLTKQFYPDMLHGSDGTDSRYNFSSTGEALITIFIILTGENWNQIMVEVMDQQKSFTPSILFIMLMMLGNFMLLNLFLAILLKSISEIGNQQKDEEEVPAVENEDAEGSGKGEEGNDQEQLNSSNSNIEEEFDQIKKQLMALSSNMNALLEGTLNLNQKEGIQKNAGEEEDADHQDQKIDTVKKQGQTGSIPSVAANEEETEDTSRSLYIFTNKNPLRKNLRNLVANSYFAGFIYHMIALNSLFLALDEPALDDKYQKDTLKTMLNLISIIFVIECVIKVICMGFYKGQKTYLKDPWNILDFMIVCFSILTWVLEASIESADISFIRGFRALRALRPLRVVSKNEGIKTVVNSLLQSIPALLNVLLIVLLFLLVFGILGIQLFKGMLGRCNDPDENEPKLIKVKQDCVGEFTAQDPVYVQEKFSHFVDIQVKREWTVPINNYDSIFSSMLTFFEISTLEMWPDMMFDAQDSVGLDMVLEYKYRPPIALLYVIYIFFTTFFIMNLFISVIVDKFNDEIKKRQGSDNFTDEQKEWVKIQRLLVHTKPKIIPVEPINCFRLQCFKIVQSQAFEYVIMTAIVINTLFLCADYYGKGEKLTEILSQANLSFVVFFAIELTLKITAYGFKYYWYVNWNKFDFIIVILSLVALEEKLLTQMNFNVTALRIIRVSRLLRMVKTSEGLRTLLKTLFMSLGNILNTAALLILILFTFSVAGMSLFGNIPLNDTLTKNTNFKTFYQSMMALSRASTGESWNDIMHACYESEGIIAVIYWLMFQLIAFFIFMNVFIAVIGESFNDNQATEDENDILALKKKDIKAFQNTWAKYNPMGELYMRTIRLPDFLRELPPPLGYQGIRIEESKLNKIIFCLNIRDHLGRVYYPEVMWTIFHSIAGMNDEKVLNCEQIANILKIVKNKYKGLGKKVNLDSLCGNKYYRKELTAIKYIQAMKILTKWRLFKQAKMKMKDQNVMKGNMGGDAGGPRGKPARNNAAENNNDRRAPPSDGANEGGRRPANNDGSGDVRAQRLEGINRQVARNRQMDREEEGGAAHSAEEGDQAQRQYYVEDESQSNNQNAPSNRRRGGNREGGGNDSDFDNLDDSADQNMPMSERNQVSQRNARGGPNRGADQRPAGGNRNNDRQSRSGNRNNRR